MIFEGLPNAPPTAHGARSAASSDGAATESLLRRCAQRCCDGAATESLLRRSRADQLRRAHSARRVELMLLRRS